MRSYSYKEEEEGSCFDEWKRNSKRKYLGLIKKLTNGYQMSTKENQKRLASALSKTFKIVNIAVNFTSKNKNEQIKLFFDG